MNRGSHFLSFDTKKHNFFIGGVGATLNTKAAVATKFSGVTDGDIFNLEIDASNNISFLLKNPLSSVVLLGSAFFNDLSITYFIDHDGIVKNSSSADVFTGCSNLKYIYVKNFDLGDLLGNKFIENNDLQFFESDKSGNLGHYLFDNENELTHLVLNNIDRIRVTATNRRTLLNLSSLKRFYAPNLTKIDSFYDLHSLYCFTGVNNGAVFYVHPTLETAGVGVVTGRTATGSPAVGETVTVNGLVYTCVASGAVEGEWNYNSNRNNNTTNMCTAMRADTRSGSEDFTAWNANDEEFAISATALGAAGNGITVTTDASLTVIDSPVTVYGGDVDDTLRRLISGSGISVVYVDNIISQDPPTDLMIYNLTANTFDIAFTPPVDNANGNDGYLVWIDDGSTKWHKYFPVGEVLASGETFDVTGYDPSTLIIKLQAFDTQFNRSVLSEPAIIQSPNTFIGGVGTTSITSPSDLATVLSLSESNIKGFAIDAGNNVSCHIDTAYNFITNAFSSDSNVTYYIDKSGYASGISNEAVKNCSNMEYLYLNRLNTSFSGIAIENMDNLKHINVSSLAGCDLRYGFSDMDSLKKLDLRNLTSLDKDTGSHYNFKNLEAIERIYIGNVTSVGDLYELYTATPNVSGWGAFKNIKTGVKIYYNSTTFGTQDRRAFNTIRMASGAVQIGDIFNVNGLAYTCISGTPAVNGEFQHNATGSTIASNFSSAVTSDTRSGTLDNVTSYVSSDTIIMRSDSTGAAYNAIVCSEDAGNTGTATFDNATFKGGNDVHAFLVHCRDDEGATLVAVTTVLSVPTPHTLASSALTATTVDLTFTAPANAYGNEAYEVWVDDGTVYRKYFEHSEITASGDTVDLTDVYNDVGSLSGVKVKIRTMDGQMNFSDFSNEITL